MYFAQVWTGYSTSLFFQNQFCNLINFPMRKAIQYLLFELKLRIWIDLKLHTMSSNIISFEWKLISTKSIQFSIGWLSLAVGRSAEPQLIKTWICTLEMVCYNQNCSWDNNTCVLQSFQHALPTFTFNQTSQGLGVSKNIIWKKTNKKVILKTWFSACKYNTWNKQANFGT